MPGTRSTASRQPATLDVKASPTQKTMYADGTLPEVWIADGSAEQFRIINLPDPKTSESRQFAYFLRRRPCSDNEAKTSSGELHPAVGEVRVFQSATPASFLVHPEDMQSPHGSPEEVEKPTGNESEGPADASEPGSDERRVFTTKQTLHMVTDIDLVFLLLPVLCRKSDAKADDDDSRIRFLPFDDLMDDWCAMKDSQASCLLQDKTDGNKMAATEATHVAGNSMESDIKEALQRICSVVDAGDEQAFGFSLGKFQKLVVSKALRLAEVGLPPSLEEHALKLVETTHTSIAVEEDTAAETPGELSVVASDTQESSTSVVFTPGAVDDKRPTYFAENDDSNIRTLARRRVALGFILANYVPEDISAKIIQQVDAGVECGVDFATLHERVKQKRESEKRVDVSQLYSNKRGANDEERIEERSEKKRKLEEEEKKKKEASHGVKALAKVNVKGMAKMTSFFQSKAKKE